MEQRKVLLKCGRISVEPAVANVGIIVTPLAVEITTVITFSNIPFTAPWFMEFPVSTANGRFVQCAVLQNMPHIWPSVAFHNQSQIVAMGPCIPQTNVLVFTIVTVYVPSFKQSFIAHLHMGTPNTPCRTIIRIRNMLSSDDFHVQVRNFAGRIQTVLNVDPDDSEWMSTAVMLSESTNYKIVIFLSNPSTFGIDKECWMRSDNEYWMLSTKPDTMPDPHLWVLKPRPRDINYMPFYASVIAAPPSFTFPTEPQELLVIAAKIICNRDQFFEGASCVTIMSDMNSLISLARKMQGLNINLLMPLTEADDSSWRTNITETPHVTRVLSLLGI